jgi:hypothetical protein
MYADNINLLSTTCNFTTSDADLTHNINSSLSKITDWLAVNKLSLNASKTKMMIFHHSQQKLKQTEIPLLKVNNQPIERAHKFQFLVIIIDSHLTWKPHQNYIGNKLARVGGILTRLKHYLPSDTLKLIYEVLLLSHVNYGITVWAGNDLHNP